MRRPLRSLAPAAAAAVLLSATACGGGDDYANRPRPPKTIVIAAAILPDRVSVSPREFGAGPISLTVANETDASQRISIVRSVNGQAQADEQTGPINPHDTATLKADVEEGEYELRVAGGGIKPAPFTVGPQRESAQNELLQP